MLTPSAIRSWSSHRTVGLGAAIIIVFLAALYGLTRGTRHIRPISLPSPDVPTASAGPNSQLENLRRISYRGVSFSYNDSLASDIKTESKPPYLLQLSSDTGQGVAPEHIAFRLVGPYASLHRSSFFSPEVLIFPIDEYRRALSKSQNYVSKFNQRLQVLEDLLSHRPESWAGEIPILPFEIGASQSFHARFEYVRFKNGIGVTFLTQYNIEPALINNEGLAYIFQGLTDDRQYWVSATFPVTLFNLPESYESSSTTDYTLAIPRSVSGHEYESFEKSYKQYLDKLARRMELLSTNSYEPDLAKLKELIESLSVRPEH